MKGFIIFENFNKIIDCKKILDGEYNCVISDYPQGTFGGVINKITSANCDKDDTYDFEVGALIALMKMCGVEKVKRAAKETFFDVAENAVNEYEEEIKNLKKRINELENYNAKLEDRIAHEQSGAHKCSKDMEKLQHEYDLCKNSENALKITTQLQNKSIEKLTKAIDGYKEDLYKVTKRCEELELKESILNKQQEQLDKREEKMSAYFGGRGNAKQYKALVALFKKIDQKKVDAAYKEAYNTILPVWQKEVLEQMYDMYKESKEKKELPRTLDINGVVYRKTIQLKDFGTEINKLTVDSLIEESRAHTRKCVDEWLYKPPTKREEMWNDILSCGDCTESTYVEVRKEDLSDFFKEAEQHKIFSINGYNDLTYIHRHLYIEGSNSFAFQIFRKPAGFVCCNVCRVMKNKKVISYLPPMRWDLFKKGRIAVKVTPFNYKDFYKNCEIVIGRSPSYVPWDLFTVSYDKKEDAYYILNVHETKKKIVDWEDVR